MATALLESSTMARTPLIRNTIYPYHLIARSNNKEWFYLPLWEVWRLFLKILVRQPVRDTLQVHAFVLMSNHFHLLASSRDGHIDKTMQYLLREVSRNVNYKAHRINHLFGGPYKWSLITTPTYYSLCLKYIYQNPVRAGICPRAEDYTYSSLRALLGWEQLPFILDHWKWSDEHLKWGDPAAVLNWINSEYPLGMTTAIQKGLRRSTFDLPKKRSSRKVPAEYLEQKRLIQGAGDGISNNQK